MPTGKPKTLTTLEAAEICDRVLRRCEKSGGLPGDVILYLARMWELRQAAELQEANRALSKTTEEQVRCLKQKSRSP